jgi:hypothetical protein
MFGGGRATQKQVPRDAKLVRIVRQSKLGFGTLPRPAACRFQLSNRLTTNLGVRSSNLFGRAIKIKYLQKITV